MSTSVTQPTRPRPAAAPAPAARWQLNPIIVKELRSRMRGGRAFATVTGALAGLAVCSYGLYRMTLASTQYSTTPLSPQIGQVLFFGLAFIELIVAAAIVPSVTAGAISGEREKETYEMLLATPLHPASILWGKLVAALGYVFLILFAAVPMASIVYVFGGVSLRDMAKTLMMLLVVTLMFGVIGLFFSTLFGRSGRATAMAYLASLGVMFAPVLAAVAAGVMRQNDPPRWMLVFSPISAVGSAMAPSVNPNNISGLFWMLGSPIYWLMGAPPVSADSIPRPLYHYSLPIYLGVTLILYGVASRLVRPARRWRLEWTEIVVSVVLLVGLMGSAAVGYFATANRYENLILPTEATPTPEVLEGTPTPGGEVHPVLVPEQTQPPDAGPTPTPAG